MPDATAPIVSVVIPVFNGARFLGAAIESCLAQDRAADEVIVVDDGSTDESVGVARSFPDVRVLELGANAGAATARNRGALVARGDVLVFHDADDLMAPTRVSVQVAALVEHPEWEVLLGRQRMLLEPGQETPDWALAEVARDGRLGVPLGVVTVRRAAFDRIGGFDPAYRVSEDADFLFRCRAAGVAITILEDVIVERRIHDANTMHAAYPSGATKRAMVQSIAAIARARTRRAVPIEVARVEEARDEERGSRAITTAPVSAIIAVRDGAAFVAEAVRSLLDQTLVPAEVLVVDDGSTDDTPEVLSSFGSAIRVIRIPPSGLARARNAALERSTQPFVAFCDADDLWLPAKTEKQLPVLERDPSLAGVFGAVDEFTDLAVGDEGMPVRAPNRGARARMAQTLLARRAAFDEVGPFDPDVGGAEFIEWLARAQSRGLRFFETRDVVARRRIHGANKTMDPAWVGELARTMKRVMDHHRAAEGTD